MLQIAIANGFSCGCRQNNIYFYNAIKMREFALEKCYEPEDVKSPCISIGHYLDTLSVELPTPIYPVYYGGNFAANATQIWNKRDALKEIEQSLMRDNSIEEGYFVERMQARLLSRSLDSDKIDVLNKVQTKITPFRSSIGFAGQLIISQD